MKYKIVFILIILLCNMSIAAATTATYTSDGKIKLYNDIIQHFCAGCNR